MNSSRRIHIYICTLQSEVIFLPWSAVPLTLHDVDWCRWLTPLTVFMVPVAELPKEALGGQ